MPGELQPLRLVRPNLGHPILTAPNGLLNFVIAVAGGSDKTPETWEVEPALRRNPPFIQVGLKPSSDDIPLTVKKVHRYHRIAPFETDYSGQKLPLTAEHHQYDRGYRWEFPVTAGITEEQLQALSARIAWPRLVNLRFGGGEVNGIRFAASVNSHALYIWPTAPTPQDTLVILHITDLHIARRNDRIPRILSEVRTERECRELEARYNNFNDNLRSLVRHANDRVRAGERVFVVATGDLVDHYYDGYINGKFICGQGDLAPDYRTLPREETTGEHVEGAWEPSNVEKFREILLGADGKGEELLCPIFTVLGNHDYLVHESLLNFSTTILSLSLYDRNGYGSFGLTQREAREYDYWAFPRREALHPSIANRKNHKESRAIKNSWAASLDHDWAYWVAKPNVKHLNQYLAAVCWDTDFTVNIGACKLVFFNTGPDRYPDKEDLIWNELAGSGDDWVKDYRNDGSHNRGVLAHHIAMLDEALAGLQDDQLLLIFSHAPFVGLEGNLNGPNDVLFEQDKRRDLRLPNPAEKRIEELYGKTRIELAADGFSLKGTRHFKNGGRDPYLNFGSADGEIASLFNRIARRKGQSTRRCVFCLAGHSHYVHEFRVERQAQAGAGTGYFYYHDNYADRVFTPTDNAAVLLARYGWQMVNSPVLATSGAVKNSTPVYREIVIRGATVKSLQMREIPDRVRTSEFRPGCRLAALRSHDGGYLRAEEGGGTTVTTAGKQAGDYETFELVRMAASSVALRSFRGHYLSWRAAPGVPGLDTMIFADRTAIDDAATFIMGETGDGTVRFRASNDKYVTADATGLHANAPSAGPRETFRLEMLE